MFRKILVLSVLLLAAACSPAPAQVIVEPEQIEAVGKAVADLADQLGLDVEGVQVVKVEDAEWSDSCLGLGGPAESCAAVVTPGYQVTLSVDGVEYVFRTDLSGDAVRMETITE